MPPINALQRTSRASSAPAANLEPDQRPNRVDRNQVEFSLGDLPAASEDLPTHHCEPLRNDRFDTEAESMARIGHPKDSADEQRLPGGVRIDRELLIDGLELFLVEQRKIVEDEVER